MAVRREGIGELALIERIAHRFADLPHSGVTLGIGDDCAILQPPARSDLLVTTDLLLEGRHFRRDLHSPESAGHRCLARGLSDLAAMGASPVAAFLSLALPPGMLADTSGRRWLDRFLRGMHRLARRAAVPLAGGDTGESAGDRLMADIVLLGSAPRGTSMRRSLAAPGDLLYVTGLLGGAAAELEDMLGTRRHAASSAAAEARQSGLRKSKVRPPRRHGPQQFPEPRLAAGVALRERGVRTAIDISDGLSTDLHHLAAASGVHASVEVARLPLHPLLKRRDADDALRLALHGGEDYELLFAAPPRLRLPARLGGVPITRIGAITAATHSGRSRVFLVGVDGRRRPLRAAGWAHFATSPGAPASRSPSRKP